MVLRGINITICKGIDTTMAKLHSVNNNRYLNLPLGDYYIKSAYNCCAVNNYIYDYVDLCGLKACLKRGVRFLDFEVLGKKKSVFPHTLYSSSSSHPIPLLLRVKRR